MNEETKERLSLLAEVIYLREEIILLKSIIKSIPDNETRNKEGTND